MNLPCSNSIRASGIACLLNLAWAGTVMANQQPLADAGPGRYLDNQPLTLDGTGSHDPDPGDMLTYQWTQLSGPALTIADANTATPTVTATPTSAIGTAILQLIVNDGQIDSAPDTVQLTIVVAVPTSIQLTLENPPFDVNKPTAVFFNGGNCVTGGGTWGLGPDWEALANIVSFVYGPPYDRPADALIAFLSRVAPNYAMPIQTSGYSTGGMPAMDSAIRLNKIFRDPHYAVSIVNLLDGACRNYDASILDFITNPVGDKGAFVQNFFSTTAGKATFRARAINVAMEGDHSLPPSYYLFSLYPQVFTTDIYNHGLVAGVFTSIPGFGPHYRVPNLASSPYYFHLVFDNGGTQVHLEPFNAAAYPGRLPQPIDLIGPIDGDVVSPAGTTLSCTSSENAVAYDFLFGRSADQLSIRSSFNAVPTIPTGLLPPGKTFYWTIQARDAYGTTFRADTGSFTTPPGSTVDVNTDGRVDASDCGAIDAAFGATWGDAAFQLAADYDGNGQIDCHDHLAWLNDYRAFYNDPQRADPCGTASSSDQDGDGVVDLCDACNATESGRPVDANGCPLPIPGDFDGDGDVDQSDYGRFQACIGLASPVTIGCGPADLDHSNTVTSSDLVLFNRCMLGADHYPSPTCTQ